MKVFKGIFYFLINPILFLKYIIRTGFLILTPRILFHKRLRGNPYKNFKSVLFNLDQRNPITQKGIIDSYSDYLTIEKAIKATLFNINEIDVGENIRKFLKEGDIFFDVGAHFGYFSALGAACVGKSGEVHIFEPAPICFEHLDNLKLKNPEYHFIVNKVGVGDKNEKKELFLSCPPHLSSHTMIPCFLETKNIPEFKKVEVFVIRLDEYIKEKRIMPKLIKIDVEGFEFAVLKGLENYFKETKYRPIIICEINPNAYSLLGHTLDDLYQFIKFYGYEDFYSWNSAIKIKNKFNPIGNNVVFRVP